MDAGLFSGKYLCFSIEVPELGLKVKRLESDFKLLAEQLSHEFPVIPLPPIVKLSKEFSDLRLLT